MDIPFVDEQEIAMKWLAEFGRYVPYEIMQDHVLGGSTMANHMWHVFTWGGVPCLTGDAARRAFDELQYKSALGFFGGWSCGYGYKIENMRIIGKASSEVLDGKRGDCYIVGKNFEWTYVKTHEADCGPYFCMRKSRCFIPEAVRELRAEEKKEIARRWISAFAKDVSAEDLKKYVLPNREFSNCLWNAFECGVPCVKGEAAWKAFDSLEYDRAVVFYGGYTPSAAQRECSPDVKLYGGYVINKAAVIGKTSAYDIDCGIEGDVYVIGKKLAWTYVKTHEGEYYYCGKNARDNGVNYV